MRFLLLSDTHGKLGIINDLAADFRADAVIHAGDFGFYDEGRQKRALTPTHPGVAPSPGPSMSYACMMCGHRDWRTSTKGVSPR